MTIQLCTACKKFIQDEAFYSLNLDCERYNCERYDGEDSIVVLTSHNLLTLCSECIDKVSVAKILSYPARVFGNTAHDGFEELQRLLNNNCND